MESIDLELDEFVISDSMVCEVDNCNSHISKKILNLKILTQNIRSVGRNFDELVVLLLRIKLDIDVIVLTECWLACNPIVPNLNGYRYYITNNFKNQNDGIIIYYKDSFNINVTEPDVSGCNCLSITINEDTNILAMYRSPSHSNIDPFLASLDSILSNLGTFKSVAIIGDLNIDITTNTHDTRATDYLNTLAFHGFLPAHTFPTRHGTTCLDHVLLRTKFQSHTLVLNSSITDHNAVLLCLYQNQNGTNPQQYLNKININAICERLCKVNFDFTQTITDPNEAMKAFISIVQDITAEHTTLVKLPRSKRIMKPWITNGILRCIKNRDRLHRESKKSPESVTLKVTYVRYRNYCNSLLKRLKRAYEKSELEKNSNNNKKLWKVIRSITSTNKVKTTACELLGEIPQRSVDEANDYFVNVGGCLANKLLTGQEAPQCPAKNNKSKQNYTSFVLFNTDEDEVLSLINGLKISNTVGHDKISNNLLKAIKHLILQPLTQLFNGCFSHGIFPHVLKKSIIVPIFKTGDRHHICNYRPIAILPVVSKILERLINNRLSKYLERNKLLSSYQFGFRSGKSTEDAVHTLTDYVVKKLDDGKKVVAVFLDLAKAFDAVSVPLLLAKLELLGIRGLQLKLFNDYLTGRKQCLKVGPYTSSDQSISVGVPQGSVLAPTLFLVYLNDLCDLRLQNGTIISYADDTALLFSADTWTDTFDYAQKGFNRVYDWLKCNILTLNPEKTSYMPFFIRNSSQPLPEMTIKVHSTTHVSPINLNDCNCSSLSRKTEIKYLGIILDSSLNYRAHISVLQSRVRKLIYIFKTLRHVADFTLMKKVYLTLCQSLLSYCISCWGGASKTILLPLEIAQRAILKVGTFNPISHPTNLLYNFWKVLTVRQLFVISTILKQHSLTTFDQSNMLKRRPYVIPRPLQFKHQFTHRFFCFCGPFLYGKLNAALNFYPLPKRKCKYKLKEILLTYDYHKTEELLKSKL